MIPLQMPNLPASPVELVVTAGAVPGLKHSLKNLSIKVLNTERNVFLNKSIANHADMVLHHLGGHEILLSKEQMFLSTLFANMELNIQFVSGKIESPYPYDAPLNAARLGKFLICNPKIVAPEILAAAQTNNLEIIFVKQGYTKCSVCVLNENTIITEDLGIKRSCEKKGIDVLLISKGSVKLRGHDYGFIGGCTGLIDKNILAFCGDIKYHTDYIRIAEFLKAHNVEPVSLIQGALQDIGGIIPIMQI